jgi:hypothetical protein
MQLSLGFSFWCLGGLDTLFFFHFGKGVEGSLFLDLDVPSMFPIMFPTSSQVPNVCARKCSQLNHILFHIFLTKLNFHNL